MKRRGRLVKRHIRWAAAIVLVVGLAAAAQTPYQPKFKGDPAKSDSEAAALGYMRTVLRAQKIYYKKNNKYAASLADLVHTGSFTKRMVNPDRGDYAVGFRPKKIPKTASISPSLPSNSTPSTGRSTPTKMVRSTRMTRRRRRRNRPVVK